MPKPDHARNRRLITRASELKPLRDSPAWDELAQIVAERKDWHLKKLIRDMLIGEPVDQRRIDRMAGYFDGMEDILHWPDLAETNAKSALKRAELWEENSE